MTGIHGTVSKARILKPNSALLMVKHAHSSQQLTPRKTYNSYYPTNRIMKLLPQIALLIVSCHALVVDREAKDCGTAHYGGNNGNFKLATDDQCHRVKFPIQSLDVNPGCMCFYDELGACMGEESSASISGKGSVKFEEDNVVKAYRCFRL